MLTVTVSTKFEVDTTIRCLVKHFKFTSCLAINRETKETVVNGNNGARFLYIIDNLLSSTDSAQMVLSLCSYDI